MRNRSGPKMRPYGMPGDIVYFFSVLFTFKTSGPIRQIFKPNKDAVQPPQQDSFVSNT